MEILCEVTIGAVGVVTGRDKSVSELITCTAELTTGGGEQFPSTNKLGEEGESLALSEA